MHKAMTTLMILLSFAGMTMAQEASSNWLNFDNDTFDADIKTRMLEKKMAGLALAMIHADEEPVIRVYQGEPSQFPSLLNSGLPPIKPSTRFRIASLSKQVLMVSIMQMVEQDLLALDVDINEQYIYDKEKGKMEPMVPFRVRNPYYPHASITPRMLLDHTSSIIDDWTFFRLFFWGSTHTYEVSRKGGHGELFTLDGFLERYLSGMVEPYDKMHDVINSFQSTYPPGSLYAYSNINAALMGYVVGRIAYHSKGVRPKSEERGKYGESFVAFSHQELLDPLQMKQTTWLEDPAQVRSFFRYAEENPFTDIRQIYTSEEPEFSFSFFPSGQVDSTIGDLAVFLRMLVAMGSYTKENGEKGQIISPETLNKVFDEAPYYTTWSYGSYLYQRNACEKCDYKVYYHDGAGHGFVALMNIFPAKKKAFALLSNTRPRTPSDPRFFSQVSAYVKDVLLKE